MNGSEQPINVGLTLCPRSVSSECVVSLRTAKKVRGDHQSGDIAKCGWVCDHDTDYVYAVSEESSLGGSSSARTLILPPKLYVCYLRWCREISKSNDNVKN